MKTLVFGLVAILSAIGLGNAVTASPSLDGDNVYVVSLKGLTGSAHDEARAALSSVKGVSQVKVDCAQAKAWITMKDGHSLDRDAVTAALTETKFKLASFQEPKGKGDKKVTLWKMVYTRGGGGGAARKANKVRAALEKVKGMKEVVVDSTATAWISTKDNKKPSREAIAAALKPLRSEISSLEKVTQPKPAAVYELVVEGVGGGNTCTKIREIFANVKDLIVVMPFGDTATVKILASKSDALTKKSVEALIAKNQGYKLKSFKQTKPASSKA